MRLLGLGAGFELGEKFAGGCHEAREFRLLMGAELTGELGCHEGGGGLDSCGRPLLRPLSKPALSAPTRAVLSFAGECGAAGTVTRYCR